MEVINEVRNKLAKFLACELDCNSGHLSVSGEQQKLEPMVLQFLLLLIQYQGHIVSKQKVLDTIWVNKKPTDEALRALVKKAREALNDNARSPTFIKTIPTKGYLFIPSVELTSTVMQSWVMQHAKFITWSLLAVITLLFALVWYFYSTNNDTEPSQTVAIEKTSLGLFNKSKVSTNYYNGNIKNAWIEVNAQVGSSDIYIRDLESKFEQRITLSTVLNRQLWFSQGSQRLLLAKKDRSGLYTLDFNERSNDLNIKEYKLRLPEGTSINAYDNSGKYIFVISSLSNSLRLLDIDTGEEQSVSSIASLQKELHATRMEFFNDESQNLSVSVWPSPTKTGFVVALSSSFKTRILYYANLDAAAPGGMFDISGGVRSAVWNKEGRRFSFTNDQYQLFAYQIEGKELISFNANGLAINKVALDCGTSCFVVANTLGIPKLVEFSNPFVNNRQYNRLDAQLIETNSIARNEHLPQYSSDGVYFISQEGEKTEIIFRSDNHQEQVIFEFDKQAIVKELTIDINENYLAGIVNQRAFIVSLSTLEFDYLPLTFPHVSHIAFTADNSIQFYAQTNVPNATKPNDSGDSSLSGGADKASDGSGLYQGSIDSRQFNLVVENAKARREIELLGANELGSNRYKGVLTLNNSGQFIVSFQNNKQPIVVDVGLNDCANCWHIEGNDLYQIDVSRGDDSSSIMTKTDLLNGEIISKTLPFANMLNTLSLNPNSNKVVVTMRRNLQTELIKIEGLVPVY